MLGRLEAAGSKAKSRTLAGFVSVGRDTAQMTAVPAWVPFDETEVRKPGSCPLGSVSNVCSWTRVGLGEVWTFQVKTRLALVTTRPTPSEPW